MQAHDNAGAAGFGISLPRVRRWSVALTGIGAFTAESSVGLPGTASFLVGALASYFNLQLLHAVVLHLGPDPLPGRRRIVTLFVLRYFAVGLLGYATVKVFGVNPASFCFGLLVASVALLLDSLFELIYART